MFPLHGALPISAGAGIGLVGDGESRRMGVVRYHNRLDRQVVAAREVEVTLVVGRAAKNGTGAVVHQHEIGDVDRQRSEEHTSELQSLMRISYAVFCLKKKNKSDNRNNA